MKTSWKESSFVISGVLVGGFLVWLFQNKKEQESSKNGDKSEKKESMIILMHEQMLFQRDAELYKKQLTDELKESLVQITKHLAKRGKGLLAADESPGTMGKRLVQAGFENTPETRRAYREVLFAHPELGKYLSGAIMFEETLLQKDMQGVLFPEILASKGVFPGVKVDAGLDPLQDSPKETQTKGMETLVSRCQKYVQQGAKFAKWRAVIRISAVDNLPTSTAMEINAIQLARYAMACQLNGLVPIIEPEILIEGTHTADRFAEISEDILGKVYYYLSEAKVFLEGTLLKPQMIMSGVDNPNKPSSIELAEKTLRVLRRRVPPAVPGIMFLSGGQTEEEATLNLNAINTMADADERKHPWVLSFSFGRSLQASVLELHKQASGKVNQSAMDMAAALAKANSEAQLAQFTGSHPSIIGNKSLHETNRGWRQGEEKTS